MRNKSLTTAFASLIFATSINAYAATSTLLGPLTFTGSNGASLPSSCTTVKGSWSIYSNAAKASYTGSASSFKMNPARANESTATSFTFVNRSTGVVKGIMCSARNGTGSTSSGYLIGADDTGSGGIWVVKNDVATRVAKGGVQYGSLDGTLTAKCDLSGTHPVLTLTTSKDSSILKWTDTADTFLSGGTDIRAFTSGSGVTFDNITISGTPLSSTTSTSTASSGTTTTTSGTTSTTTSSSTTTSGTTTTSSTTGTSAGSTTSTSGTTGTTSGSTSTTSSSTSTTTTATPVTHSAALSWSIPTTRTDGTALALSELAGYEVYYTDSTGTTNVSVPVSGGTTTSTTVSNLTSGTYYFSMSAIDTSGQKSPLSAVNTVTIP